MTDRKAVRRVYVIDEWMVSAIHRMMPRFGHTSEVAMVRQLIEAGIAQHESEECLINRVTETGDRSALIGHPKVKSIHQADGVIVAAGLKSGRTFRADTGEVITP